MINLAPENVQSSHYDIPAAKISNEIGNPKLGIIDLEQTEGFSKLSPRQQKMIRTSLLITKRAWKPGNLQSTTHLNNLNCHGMIASLENEEFYKVRSDEDKLPDNFFRARYIEIQADSGQIIADRLMKDIKTLGFPCVVHVCFGADTNALEDNPSSESRLGPDHSFLVLGYNKAGKIVTWDKDGFSGHYRVITVEEQCKNHKVYDCWGIRCLRKNQSTS